MRRHPPFRADGGALSGEARPHLRKQGRAFQAPFFQSGAWGAAATAAAGFALAFAYGSPSKKYDPPLAVSERVTP